jgi:hypothetical protein
MSKHTPGPWEVVDSFYPSIKEVMGPSFNVKAVMWATDLTERDYQERLADLRLIAAAPELLEALETWLEQYSAEEYEDCPEVVQTRAAIAKATGGAK